jgi:hypothetical protein
MVSAVHLCRNEERTMSTDTTRQFEIAFLNAGMEAFAFTFS